jgi:hypothetical protein
MFSVIFFRFETLIKKYSRVGLPSACIPRDNVPAAIPFDLPTTTSNYNNNPHWAYGFYPHYYEPNMYYNVSGIQQMSENTAQNMNGENHYFLYVLFLTEASIFKKKIFLCLRFNIHLSIVIRQWCSISFPNYFIST